ncbi:1-acyl-sn-glycerol-3-phosphate acyltransferase [hydrothermal vent metagenome]|uniref:1-acyl-sn-glycerol-3-phosphate acyltransferase n=1 Tax=hydrothermal vent metagenome TaxID=652676 RepID=A0A3B0RCW1_9ZZZZ
MSAKITGQLLTQRKFAPLLVAQALGAFNDNIIKFSLMILTGYGLLKFGTIPDRYMVPLAANTFVIPIFLFSAISGQLADKIDRAKIMRMAKLGEIFLMGLAAAGFLLHSAPILFVTLFLMGTQSAIFAPARLASMPYFLNDDELVPGNALVSGNVFLFTLSGSLFGTLLVAKPSGPLLITAVLILCSLAGWFAIRFLPKAPPPDENLKVNPNFLASTFQLLKFVTEDPKILRPIIGIAWFYGMGGAFLAVLPIYVKDVLGLDNSVVAVFIAIFSVGAALGSISCGILSSKQNAILYSIAGLCALTIFTAGTYLLSNQFPALDYTTAGPFLADSRNWPLMVSMFGSSIASGMFVVPLQAMAQRRAHVDVKARTMAGSALMNAVAAIIGQFTLVYTGLAGLSVQSAFFGMAFISGLGAIYMIRSKMKGAF